MSRLVATLVLLFAVQSVLSDEGEHGVTPISPEPLYELDEVVIIASRKEMLLRTTPDIIQVVGKQEIDEMKPTSTGELIEYTSGVSVETGTGSGLPERSVVSVNGLPANYTLVLLDGVRLVTEHIHTGQNLEFVPPESIERLEIMRGASSAQYGTDAIGGIVNVVTRKCRDQWSAELKATAGSYGTYETSANLLLPIRNSVRLSSSFNWKRSNGIPLKAPAHRVDNMGYERLNLLNRIESDLGPATKVFGSLNWVDNSMDWRGSETTSHLVSPSFGITHVLPPGIDLSARVSYSDWDAELNSERNRLLEPEAYASWQISPRQKLMAGVDYRWNEFERTAVDAPDQAAYGVFVQHEWSEPNRFALMIAARYDKVEDIDGAFSPKMSLLVQPESTLRLRASVGRGFHAPTLQELYEEGYGHGGTAYRFGNPNLDSEYSTTYTTGLEADLPYDVQVMVYGFYNDIEDMIVPVYQGPWEQDPEIDVWRRTNIENAKVYGGEANVSVQMGRHVRVQGGYTVTKNKDLDSGRKLPYCPGSTAHGKVNLTHGLRRNVDIDGFLGVRAAFDREAWNWKPEAGAPEDDPGGLTTPLADYTKLDAGLTLSYNRTYEAFLKIENILGEDIENLDDAYTVLDGEPVLTFGLSYTVPLTR